MNSRLKRELCCKISERSLLHNNMNTHHEGQRPVKSNIHEIPPTSVEATLTPTCNEPPLKRKNLGNYTHIEGFIQPHLSNRVSFTLQLSRSPYWEASCDSQDFYLKSLVGWSLAEGSQTKSFAAFKLSKHN